MQNLDKIAKSDIQFIWQTGKYYKASIAEQMKGKELPNLKIMDFISDMGAAYKAADLVIILVPSPNVAEDHQTKNTMALVNKDAAIYVKDCEAPGILIDKAINTVTDSQKLNSLSENIKKLGLKNSADVIADEVVKLARK